MQRYIQILRDTWWLWLFFFAATFAAIFYVNAVFVVMLPVLISVFFYLAVMRYNPDGTIRRD